MKKSRSKGTSKYSRFHSKTRGCNEAFGREGNCLSEKLERYLNKAEDPKQQEADSRDFAKDAIKFLKKLPVLLVEKTVNGCAGDFMATEVNNKKSTVGEMTCATIPYDPETKLGTFAFSVLVPTGCGALPVTVSACFTWNKCGTVGFAINGGIFSCISAATGIGEVAADALKMISNVGIAFSATRQLSKKLEIFKYDVEANAFKAPIEVTTHGHFFLTAKLSLASILGLKIGEFELEKVLQIGGTIHAMIDFGHAPTNIANLINDLRGNSNIIDVTQDLNKHEAEGGLLNRVKKLFDIGAEVSLGVEANVAIKLEEYTLGILSDIDLASAKLNVLVSIGTGSSGTKTGVYAYFNAGVDVLKSFAKFFNKMTHLMKKLHIDIPEITADLSIEAKLGFAIQSDALAIMVDSRLISIMCAFKYAEKKLSCKVGSEILTFLWEHKDWVVHKAEKLFHMGKKLGNFMVKGGKAVWNGVEIAAKTVLNTGKTVWKFIAGKKKRRFYKK